MLIFCLSFHTRPLRPSFFYTQEAFQCGTVSLHGLGSYRWSYYFILEGHFDVEQSHSLHEFGSYRWFYYFIHKGHFEVEQSHFMGLVAIDGSTILDLLL